MAVETFWPSVLLPLLAGLLLSFAVERLLRPGISAPWRRPFAAIMLHCGSWLLLYAAELIQFRRPWFTAVVSLTLLIVLALVSNAKYRALREPFIYQDFEYFLDTLRHPRLYLPFFGLGKALAAMLGFLLSLAAGLRLEPALTEGMSLGAFLLDWAVLTGAGLFAVALGMARPLPLALEPETDVGALGLLASLWRYGAAERQCPKLITPFAVHPAPAALPKRLPHLVAVQSESFVDVRKWGVDICPEVLAHFDALNLEAVCRGQLQTPAWGANTVRTEFAFLSGLPPERLGIHRFNPYRRLARRSIATLAGLLRERGYRTVCVHPYPASFYGRDRLFGGLGFDQFLDVRHFSEAEKSGPYIGDAAVAEKVCALLSEEAAGPLFVFVVTMENHGPLHWEKVEPDDTERLYTVPPPTGCEDLTVYLRHLANADRMARTIANHMRAMDHPAWLCWFGDHVPIMPEVYDLLGLPDGRTDYLLWTNGHGGAVHENTRDLAVEDLGGMLMAKAGLIGGDDRRPSADGC